MTVSVHCGMLFKNITAKGNKHALMHSSSQADIDRPGIHSQPEHSLCANTEAQKES